MAATPAPIAPATSESTPLPFRPGTPDELARLREFLVTIGFTFPELKRRQQLAEDARRSDGPRDAEEAEDAIDVLSFLFHGGQSLSWDRLRRAVPTDGLELLTELGLIANAPASAGEAHATAMINPIAGLHLLSDHLNIAPGLESPPDVVFSPLTPNTQQFVVMLPSDACDTALELCSGTGIAAFMAARSARHVWAVDITERSTLFAKVNATLNGIANVTVLQGDLYEPVRGLIFDRIVVHPPYMPAFEQEMIFRDGGADGEQVTRRIVAGLPDVLRPGGRLYCVCLATDREEPLEMRVRGWLGERADEFDVMFVDLREPLIPASYYAQRAYESNSGFADLEARHRFFRDAQVTSLVFGVLVVQRRAGDRPTFTRRHRGSVETTSAQIEWAVRWESAAANPLFPGQLVDARPHVSNHVAVRMTHERRGDAFVPTHFEVLTDTPFRVALPCKPWFPTFLARCDGRATVRDHLVPLQEKGIMAPNVTAEEFAQFVMDQIGLGILEVADHEIPPPASSAEVLLQES